LNELRAGDQFTTLLLCHARIDIADGHEHREDENDRHACEDDIHDPSRNQPIS